MKITNKTNVLYLIAILLCASLFFNGCGGGGGGGSVSSQAVPGGGTSAGPSITVEGEIDAASLGLDLSSFSSAPARAGSDVTSRFAVVAVENQAYKKFRKNMLKSAAGGANYAPMRGIQNIDDLLNSGATISSGAGSLIFSGGKLIYSVDIPLTFNQPDSSLLLFDKNNGVQLLSTSLGVLPNSNDITISDPNANGFNQNGGGTISNSYVNASSKILTIGNSTGDGLILNGFGNGTITDNGSGTVKITNSGDGSNLTITGNSSALSIVNSGMGNYKVNNIGGGTITIDSLGSGSIITNNSSNNLTIGNVSGGNNITLNGSGNVQINNITSGGTITNNGTGLVTITNGSSFNINGSGSGNIKIFNANGSTNASGNAFSGKITIGGLNMNSLTTAQSIFNIENNISSNIGLIDTATINKIFSNSQGGILITGNGNINISSSNSDYCNIGAINNIINVSSTGILDLSQLAGSINTINKTLVSDNISGDIKNGIISNMNSGGNLITGMVSGFVNCITNDTVIKNVSGISTSVNIGGTLIDSRTTPSLINNLQSNFTNITIDSRIPSLSSVKVSPAFARAGETVSLAFKADIDLAGAPKVYIFGRNADVSMISASEYVARVEAAESDQAFSFTIDSIIGVNGKKAMTVSATTDGSAVSVVKTASNVPFVHAPVIDTIAGGFNSGVNVVISTKTTGALIRYTTDGTEPTASNGVIYQDAIAVSEKLTIKAIAVFNGSTSFVTAREIFPPVRIAESPVFSVPGGQYNREQAVEITSPTTGAKIRYTLDGSAPSKTSGTLYSTAVKISRSATLKAVAYGENMHESIIATAIYAISEETLSPVAAPVITPASGAYNSPQAVSIGCATSGASIRYTLDGTAPSFSVGALYSSSFVVSKTSLVRAIAFKTGMTDSDIVSSNIEITGEAEIKPPLAGIAEIEPKRDGTQVNSDFNITLAAPAGAVVTAMLDSANALAGVTRVVASGGLAVLPVGVSGLVEGATSEIKIKAVNAAGETIGELAVAVKKDTVAPRREKMSVASSNQGGASIAELGDRIVISLLTDEPVKNVVATMMGKPVTIRNTDARNWTVARYLDGTEDASTFDFIINFTDLAGNSVAYPLNKKDINDGAPLMLKVSGGNSSFDIFRKDGVNKLYLSAVPPEMEYSIDGASNEKPGTWFSGTGAEVDLSGLAGTKYIFVRQKGVALSAQCLGRIIGGPAYGIDEANSSNRWAFDASTGAVILTNLNDGGADLDESKFSIHIYSGAGAGDGQLVMDYYLDPVASGSTGKAAVPSFVKSSWTAGEYVSFYLKTNNGTPDITQDDVYVQPAAGVAVKTAPVNSAEAADGNFIYDGRSNSLVFANGGGALTGASVLAGVGDAEPVKLAQSSASASSVTYRLPYQPMAGNELSVTIEYKDRSVSGTTKLTVSGAPQNLADGFGNFSVKALLGQISVTNFDSARDGYTAFASTDNGITWKELGRISSNVGQNFNVTLTSSSKVKLAMRDIKGNFSPTQAEGISPMAAPANAASGDRTFLVLGHVKKLEVNNATGAMNGFNVLYSFDGGINWNSTASVSETGRQRLDLPEFILPGSKIKVALLEWSTGNASFASDDYILKAANNRFANAIDGDYIVKASEKKVYINNASASLNGYAAYVNEALAGQIGTAGPSFSYQPNASNEVEIYYADQAGNTWLSSKSKPVAVPKNNKLADGDFFVNVFEGKITFKNGGGKMTGLVPMASADGGATWKELGPALAAGDKEFAFALKAGDSVAAAFRDADGNVGGASEPYLAFGPKLNTPVKMLLAGDGGTGSKAGLIVESGRAAVKLRPGVALKNGEALKVTLKNGGSVAMTAKVSLDGVVPVFGEASPGVTFEAGAAGNGNVSTGSFNLTNPGGAPVTITGTVEVAAIHSDALGNVSPVSKAYLTADTTPPSWAAGYPSLSAPAYFKLKAGIQTNEDGRIYLVCLKSTEAAPTAAQIKLGQNASGAAVAAGMKAALDFTVDDSALSQTFTGLDNNTEYAVHAVAEDGYENLQAQPAVIKLKTLNNTAPIWTSGCPAVSAPEFNKLRAAVKMNETGSVYLACRRSGLAALTAAQVKAGTDASGAALEAAMKAVITVGTADSEAVHIFGGLESDVEYDIYAVAADEYGETQANPTIVKMKTIDDLPPVWAMGYPNAQPSYFSIRVNLNADKTSSVYLLCQPAGGAAPSNAQIKAGTDASGVAVADNFRGSVIIAPNTPGFFNFNNLQNVKKYDIFVAAENSYQVSQASPFVLISTTIYFDGVPPTLFANTPSKESLYTMDADGNGRIDHIVARFSETVRADNIATGDVAVADGGYTYTVNGVKVDSTGTVAGAGSDGIGGSGQFLIIRVTERGVEDAGVKPTVTIAEKKIFDTFGNAFAGILVPTASFDRIAPRLIGGIPGAANFFTVDADANNKIDHIVLKFNETVTSATILPADITVSDSGASYNYTVMSVKTDANGLVATAAEDGDSTEAQFLVIRIAERNVQDSGVKPAISIAANKLGDVSANYYSGLVATLPFDSVKPGLAGGAASSSNFYTMDADSDGQIDHLVVKFTETISNSNFVTGDFTVADGGYSYTVAGAKTDADGLVATAAADGDGTNSEYLVLRVNERGASDGEIKPTLAIAADKILDPAGNAYPGIVATATFDRAAPVLNGVAVSASNLYTRDFDENGQIDHIVVRFNEAVKNSTIVAAGFTVAGYTVASVTTDADGIVGTAAADGDAANSQYALIKLNESGSSDTHATPAVTIGANKIADVADNFYTGLSAAAAYDRSAPMWTSNPAASTIKSHSIAFNVNATETGLAGTAYFVCLPDGAAAPTAAQVKAGTDAANGALAANFKGSVAAAAGNNASLSATSLVQSTNYDIYVTVEDAALNARTPYRLDAATVAVPAIPGGDLASLKYSKKDAKAFSSGATCAVAQTDLKLRVYENNGGTYTVKGTAGSTNGAGYAAGDLITGVTALADGTTISYCLVDPAGNESTKSNNGTVPYVPSGVGKTEGDTTVTISWSNSAAYTSSITGNNGIGTLTASGSGAQSKTYNSLSNGTAYTFTIYNTDGSGNVSGNASITATPVLPVYTLSGTITDSTGNVVPGATITTNLTSVTSDSSGNYSVSASGNNTVTYSKAGFVSQTPTINMTGNKTQNIVLLFTPGSFRFVLEWDVTTPNVDIDSYTSGPGTYAKDMDDLGQTAGHKREITTVSGAGGLHTFKAYNYSHQQAPNTFACVGCTVKVYNSNGTLIATVANPANDVSATSGKYWNAIIVDNSSGTVVISSTPNTVE